MSTLSRAATTTATTYVTNTHDVIQIQIPCQQRNRQSIQYQVQFNTIRVNTIQLSDSNPRQVYFTELPRAFLQQHEQRNITTPTIKKQHQQFKMGLVRGCEMTMSYIAHSVFRFIQIVFALAVCGLYGVDLNRANKAGKYSDGKWVYLFLSPPFSVANPRDCDCERAEY